MPYFTHMEQQLPKIVAALEAKAVMKQGIYKTTQAVFEQLQVIAKAIEDALSGHFSKIEPKVEIEFKRVNDFEFQLRFGGDSLVFTMHTNVTTMGEEHIVLKSPYVQEDPMRGYFGSILIYNFMADSIKHNRLNDFGYLVGRLLVNKDGHFYVEGLRQLNFLFPDIANNIITAEILLSVVEYSMMESIEQDLVSPSFHDIQVVTLEIKQATQVVNAGSKVGFQSTAARD